MRTGNAELAARVCLESLDEFPEDANILCLAGRAFIALRQFTDARVHIEKARSLHPGFPVAHETFADLMLVEGKIEAAIKSYEHTIHLDPGRSDVHIKISRAREMMTQAQPGTETRRKKMPFAEEISNAAQLERNGEPGKAENIYRDILTRDPDHVEAMRLLAVVATKHHKYRDAEVMLLRAVARAPDYARAWLDLSTVQCEQEKHPESIESAERVVELVPDMAESHIALANARARAGLGDEAILSYQHALELAPKHPGAFSGLGHQLKTLGRQPEAIAVHRRNISANPKNTEPYWSLANMKTFRFEDDEVHAMEALLDDETLDDLPAVQLCNALGLEYEGRQDYDRAFGYFQRCNQKRRRSEIYDPVDTESTTDRQIEIFTEQFLREHAGHGVADSSPIFIVGLPRSGSTLVEQILASHSQVEGTHELSDLPWVVRSIPAPKVEPELGHFPEVLTSLGERAWAKIGNQYLERTRKYRGDLPRFIDKNPNNFMYAGLLHLVLPNAKIINARRHPLDSCFGSYKQLFAGGQPFTYDLTELGEYYVQYQRLMDHWQQVLPGNVLHVDYEDVVENLESQVSRILEFCELPFEDACVNFHETDRAVKTASSEQVRQPIYESSVNLWRHYESHLGELIEILEPMLRGRPAADRPRIVD